MENLNRSGSEKKVREIDVNVLRGPEIALHDLTNTDDVYTFYYDETNNVRRLHVTAGGFNVREPLCFVLGGVVHRGSPRALDVAALKATVRLQVSAKELKLAHLGKGGFLDLLKAWRVEAYLDWLAAEGLLVHYSAIDPLYWSTVDIVDSIISHDGLAHMQAHHFLLKADLFTILAADIDDVADLFHRYSFPDVGDDNRIVFIGELLKRLDDRAATLLPEFNAQVLKGVLQGGARHQELVYLRDETPNNVLDGFVDFFIQRICLFKNARHLLDVEPVIQEALKACAFCDGDQPLNTFAFVDSQSEPGVQVSDALVGLLGKFLSYVARTSPMQLKADRQALTQGQKRTLAKLNAILDRSDAETSALLHHVMSVRTMRAKEFFLTGV
jgi:hypothetical protein